MNSIVDQTANTVQKLAEQITEFEKRATVAEKALDIAVIKLAQYEHMAEAESIADEMLKKGYVSEDDKNEKIQELYKMSTGDLDGIRKTLGLMSHPLPTWGGLDFESSLGGSEKNSNEYLEDLLDSLKGR